MNLTERGRRIVRETLLASALFSPFEAIVQPVIGIQNISSQNQGSLPIEGSPTSLAPSKIDQSSPIEEIAKEFIPTPSDWVVAKSYTSDFTNSEDYRVNNIIAGANALNNWFWDFDEKLVKYGKNVIKPGETFSISSVLGEVTDFVDGKAIGPDLQPITVYGGGICQIPTTMFVAALNAGLFVEERTNHSYYNGWYFGDPNDSKEFGMDATVYIPGVDLVVRNTYDYPIRFFFKVEEDHLRADVMGSPEMKPYYTELDGPYFYRTERRADKVGKYPWAARTIVTQKVWRDDSKQELLFSQQFESYYQASPYK